MKVIEERGLMKLLKIPEDKYYDYRLQAMFDCYKWDPQFYGSNTLSKYILLLTKEELSAVYSLRKAMSTMPQAEVVEQLLSQMMATKTNKDLVDRVNIVFKNKTK